MRSRNQPVIEATTRKVGLILSRSSWIRVQDLHIRRFSDFGVQVNGEHVLLEKLAVEDIGQSGLFLTGLGRISVHNCDLWDISSNGIESYANNVAIDGGSIRRISVTPGWLGGSRSSASATGITVRGAASSVRGVRLDSIGYDGIKATGPNAVISGNTITNFCLRLEDGGGIYLSADKAHDSRVDSNRISNPRQETPERDIYLRNVAGIYMDENTKSCHLGANTIDGGGRGIFLHNSAGNQVVRNTIHGYAYHGIAMEEDGAARDSLRDNSVIGNRTGGGGVSLMRLKKATSISSPGDFHGNFYEVTRAAAVFSLDDLTRNRWGSATWAQWSERGFDKDAVFLPSP